MDKTIVLIFLTFVYKAYSFDPLSDEFIDYINSLNTTWRAGRNFHRNTSLSYIKGLCGVKKGSVHLPLRSGLGYIKHLPKNFDSREKWPYCPGMNEIRDQGRCGSCWAFAAAEVMTDRYCIASKGKKLFHFSAEDVMTCSDSPHDGCDGGLPSAALKYWTDVGVVSGGNYKSGEGCKPYTIESCDHTGVDKTKPCQPYDQAPSCSKTCQGNYSVEYKDDLKRGKEAYYIKGEKQMMEELYTRGPITVSFDVYADFIHHQGPGVYQHKAGPYLSGHAVKVIGYGVYDGVKYWLIANSWSRTFGVKGFIKFLRGSKHCNIESDVSSGIADIE